MNTISNDLELYAIKGNVTGGKILLFNRLEKQNLTKEQIEKKVVHEYQIMKPQHFVRSWREYTTMKQFLNYETE
tara:strand:- start:176 stop:397 length:222 start_codon:yes stop_codon:yes gene_type:complete